MKIRIAAIYIIILCLASCANEPYWPDTEKANGVRYTLFDFCSTFDCVVTLDMDPQEFVYIYTEDPSLNPNAEAVRTLWTDRDGRYECVLTLPTALIGKTIYASTLNGIIKSNVTQKGAAFKSVSRAESRATEHGDLHPTTDLCLEVKNAYLNRMDRYCKDNLSKLVETGEIAVHTKEDNTQVVFTFLHSYGWNSNFMYYYYYRGEDPINSENRDEYIDKICNDKDSRFLCTKGWGVKINNKDGNNPEEDDVEILTASGSGGINLRFCDIDGKYSNGVVEVPADEDERWSPTQYIEKNNSTNTERTINSMIGISNHLYFYGDISLDSDEYLYSYEDEMPFPKGYKIGLILKSVKHLERRDPTKADAESVNYFFSNPNLNNPDILGNQIHAGRFWTSEEVDNFSRFVYGFEDSFNTGVSGQDYNFTDFLCMVSTDPIANVADVASLSATYSAVSGTLLFEDLFPRQGDYDMNDVIVEYRKVKEYERRTVNGVENDCIRNFYIELTPVHCGAVYDDYLYINVNPKNTWRLMLAPQLIDFKGAYGMSLKNVAAYNESQIVSGNPKDLKTIRTYVIKDWVPYGQPSRAVALTDAQVPFADLEAFLYVSDTNREVHITGNQCAGVNGSSNDDLDEYMKMYKAPQAQDGTFLPWAMDIPIKSDSHGYRGFIPVTEAVKITDEYLSFFDWYNGDKSKAWYENKYHRPKGSSVN